MGTLWKFMKIALVLAIGIPLLIIAMTMALGLFSALTALAFVALRIAVIGLVIYGAIRFVFSMFSSSSRREKRVEVKSLPPVDPHYEAAMRELDQELGERSR